MVTISIEAKSVFLNSLESRLSSILLASDLPKVLSTVSDQLESFAVEQTNFGAGENDDLLDAYVSAMQIQGRSEKTIERYRYLITKLMSAVCVKTRSVTVYHLRKYLADEKMRGISDRTLEGIRQVFSAYFNWLQREGLISQNPTANLGAIKYQQKIKDTYSEVDIEKLKFLSKTIRDRAIVLFLRSTGCRISEMTQLNRDSVNIDALECVVLGKGNKERTVYLSSVAGMALREYLNTRKDDNPALFIGKRCERLTPHGVRYMLSQLEQTTGVQHVHPHKFRRTLATNLIRHGMPIQEVSTILGHSKLDTTMQYIILNKEDIKNSYQKYA